MKSVGGEMVDMRDSKSCATKRGGSSPLRGILLSVVGQVIIPSRKRKGNRIVSKLFL